MEYGKLRYLKTSLFFVLSFLLLYNTINAQQKKNLLDSISMKVFDENLNEVQLSKIIKKKPIVIVSNTNCASCVTYFTAHKKDYQFVFILFGESLMEIQRIKAHYKFKKSKIFFTNCEYITNYKEALCNSPTPCMVLNNDQTIFIDYVSLSGISNEFTLDTKEFLYKISKK